jgi:hypothetical protein
MAWSILNQSTLCVENIKPVHGGLDVVLNWGYYKRFGNDFLDIANSKVADYIRHLGFVNTVEVRDGSIRIKLTTFEVSATRSWRGPWVKVPKMPGKRTLATMRRTINNKMPGIAFWAEKQVTTKSNADRPNRVVRGIGQTAIQAALA